MFPSVSAWNQLIIIFVICWSWNYIWMSASMSLIFVVQSALRSIAFTNANEFSIGYKSGKFPVHSSRIFCYPWNISSSPWIHPPVTHCLSELWNKSRNDIDGLPTAKNETILIKVTCITTPNVCWVSFHPLKRTNIPNTTINKLTN